MTELKDINELKVYRSDLLAGVLRRTSMGCEFEYSPEFIQTPTYQKLAYRIPKQETPYQHMGVNLPPFFAGLLPEGLRLKALVRELKTSEDDLFSLLAAIGENSVGDIYTKAIEKNSSKQEIPSVNQIDFYQFFETHLKKGLLSPGEEGIAGVQEKISASMISFPIRVAKKNQSYILKLNPKDKPNLVYNENQCLILAKKCGLEVNKAKIVFDKNKNPGLLVERFDRKPNQNNEIKKIHQEDACQFLNRYPADKYRLSYQEISKGVEELATAPSIEILKLLQLYVFSYLIGNGDLHGKNISLQTRPETGRIQLTPCYDLICTYIYKDRKMALKLNGRDSEFKRRYFIEFGSQFGLNEKSINQMIDTLINKVTKNQGLLLEIPDLDKKDKRLIETMIETRTNELRN